MSNQSRMLQALLPYAGGSDKRKPIAVVDLETKGLGGEFLYGAYATETEGTIHYFDNLTDWVKLLLSYRYESYIWYAHNGGEYDYKYILREVRQLASQARIRLISQGISQRLIGAKIKLGRHLYELRDSFSLVPCKLEIFLRDFAPLELQKGSINFDQFDFDCTNSEHIDYLRRDTLGLLAALVKLRETVHDTFDVPLGWTAGATAMRAWRRTLAPGAIYWRGSEQRDLFCRQAYHGGLVTLSNIAPQENIIDVDVNAMYAHSMRYGVPDGRCAYTDSEQSGYPGIYQCEVNCPESQEFTFLPYTHPLYNCLTWPTGRFNTPLTSIEIAAARQHGIDVRVGEGVVWESIATPFNDFLAACERLELQATSQSSAIKQVAKILRNSLYGKFGSHAQATVLCFEPDDPLGWTPVIDLLTGDWHGLWSREEVLQAPYLHPEWAAFITARARIVLSNLVYAAGATNCMYTDTDSLKLRANCVNNTNLQFGRCYGQVKLVDTYQAFQAGGPKNYIGLTTHGEWKQACKGIPLKRLSPAVHLRALAGEDVIIEFLSLNASRRVIGMGADFVQWRHRRVSHLEHARGWRHMGNGDVRPLHLQ